jgi:hypothetical protein
LDKDGRPYNGYLLLEDERDWASYDEKLKGAGVWYPTSYKKLKLENLHNYFLILRECYIDVIHSYHLQWIGPKNVDSIVSVKEWERNDSFYCSMNWPEFPDKLVNVII